MDAVAMSDSFDDRKRVVKRVMIATFVGLHVPLSCLFLFGLLTGLSGLGPVLWLTLGATLVASAGTLLYMRARLWPREDNGLPA